MNKPYVKKYDSQGLLTNPITKKTPYLTEGINRRQQRQSPGRAMSNKKGIQLIVTQTGPVTFAKTYKHRMPDGRVNYTVK